MSAITTRIITLLYLVSLVCGGSSETFMQYWTIAVNNKCSLKVEVAVYWKDMCGKWHTDCGWTFDAGEYADLWTNGKEIRTPNTVYFYARTKNSGLEWDADANDDRRSVTKKCGGRTMDMFEWDETKNGNEIYVELSCNNRSGNLRSGENATDLVLTVNLDPDLEDLEGKEKGFKETDGNE